MVKMNEIKGITLVSLVVTIIVLIILAGVSINLLVGDKGIVTKAKEGRDKYANAAVYEQEQLTTITKYADSITSGGGTDTGEIISKQESFIGCYADVDGNGTIDGVIYADLLIGKPDAGIWGEDDYTHDYSLPTGVTTSNVKNYVISEETKIDARFDNTPRYVISPSRRNSGSKDRFYVMGLNDLTDGTNNDFYWYSESLFSDYELTESDTEADASASENCGSGKSNTTKMLAKWNAEAYGPKDDRDLWKWIDVGENGVNKGWFVPSIAELTTYAVALNITEDNYTNFHMSPFYWSSSYYRGKTVAWAIEFGCEYIDSLSTCNTFRVRLATTF